ncbi:hypothetical protein AB9H29_12175 [Stenotrophomonas sepilia]|uniref:hypothetical protein n=1 Tax=Stenotrophomonas sepilia TaxID=2860290 RepID=UPI0035566302
MTPNSELDRLFPAIPKPDPLAPVPGVMVMRTISVEEFREMYPPIDPVDADETTHGPCAQGDCDE